MTTTIRPTSGPMRTKLECPRRTKALNLQKRSNTTTADARKTRTYCTRRAPTRGGAFVAYRVLCADVRPGRKTCAPLRWCVSTCGRVALRSAGECRREARKKPCVSGGERRREAWHQMQVVSCPSCADRLFSGLRRIQPGVCRPKFPDLVIPRVETTRAWSFDRLFECGSRSSPFWQQW